MDIVIVQRAAAASYTFAREWFEYYSLRLCNCHACRCLELSDHCQCACSEAAAEWQAMAARGSAEARAAMGIE
jgi:hypothetical protein